MGNQYLQLVSGFFFPAFQNKITRLNIFSSLAHQLLTATSLLFVFLWIYLFWMFHVHRILYVDFLCVASLIYYTVFKAHSYWALSVLVSLLRLNNISFCGCTTVCLFMYPFCVYLGSFHILAVVNSATLCSRVHCIQLFLGIYLDPYGDFIFDFLSNHQMFSR